MNLRKALFVFGGGGIIVIILAYRFGLFEHKELELPKTQIEHPLPKPTPKSPSPKVEEQATEKPQVEPKAVVEIGSGDPFNYSTNNGGDFTSMAGGKRVNNISIKGIIQMEGKEPIAILHLADKSESYYVSKGDVIRVNTESKNSALITESYIVVKDVRQNEVELIQQERPDKVIIIR